MKASHKILFTLLFILCGAGKYYSQLTTSSSSYTACPNQIVTVTATWPNVSITNLSLSIPSTGSATNLGNLGTNTTFTISFPGAGISNWILYGSGNSVNGTVTSTYNFQLNIIPPPALSITNTINYCPGNTATIIAEQGGNTYNLNGPVNILGNTSNVFTIPNIGPSHAGVYTVTSISGCTATGVTTINVAPNNFITPNTTSNVCQGSSFTLAASMPGGYNFQWQHLNNFITFNPTSFTTVTNAQPGHAGVYLVYAEYNFNNISCPKTATTQVNVVAIDQVVPIASPSSILCEKDKLNLSTTGAANAAGFTWTGPSSFASTSPTPVVNAITPLNAGVYSVTALFTNNFVSCFTKGTVQVQVVPVKQPVISMPNNVCQNTTFTMSASGGTNSPAWSWFGPNFSSANQSTLMTNVQPDKSGTYYVTAVYSIGSTTCASTSPPHQLNVVQVNTVNVIPPKPVCQPDNALLVASSTGANQFNWQGPKGFNITSSSPNAIVYYPTPSASGIYTVTAFFFGQGGLTCTNSNTVSLKVNPVMVFTLIPRQMACYNTTLGVDGPAGATSYTWSSSTGFSSNSKDIFFSSIQPKDAGNYTLHVSLGECITSSSTNIVVLTPIQFTLTPYNRTICRGDTVVLEGGVTGGSENYAYLWNPSVYLDSPIGPIKKVAPVGTVQYNLIVHDIACPNYTIAFPFEVTVKQPPQPDVDLTTRDGRPLGTEGCAPYCVTFNPNTKKEAFITTFDFGNHDQFQADSTNTIEHCFREPGTYTVNIISKGLNGCTGVYTYPSPIVVHSRPEAEIIWSPEKPTTSDEITFHPAGKTEIVYNSWTFEGGESLDYDTLTIGSSVDSTTIRTPRRKYEKFGKYHVMLVAINEKGCVDTVNRFIDVIDDLNIYIPNSFTPNGDGINDYFGVKGQGIRAEGFTMDLYDRWGASVFFTRDPNDPWDGKVKGVKAGDGVYTYRIRVVGMNGEGRKELVGHFTLLK